MAGALVHRMVFTAGLEGVAAVPLQADNVKSAARALTHTRKRTHLFMTDLLSGFY